MRRVNETRIQVDIVPPVDVAPERWRSMCRSLLGLDPAQADAIREKAPVTLHLIIRGDANATSQRLERELGRTRPSARIERCIAHPALIGDRCPTCEDATACGYCLAFGRGECARCARKRSRRTTFRNVRVAILLFVLAAVGLTAISTRRRLHAWVAPLRVAVVPVAAPGDRVAEAYVRSILPNSFSNVGRFLLVQAQHHQRETGGIETITTRAIEELPPDPPDGSSRLDVILWSLKLRWFDVRAARAYALLGSDVRIYVVFHAVTAGQSLDASVGLEEGHVGIVQAPVGERDHGWVLLAVTHELLHTLGASDKYDDAGNPRMPEGLGEPDKNPTLPQEKCEVMAGTIAVDADRHPMARSLEQCVVNRFTASEIGWH